MRSTPFRFVFILGVVSLFADMTYEGGRSVAGPFLARLGATGLVVGCIAGFGEFLGYGSRFVSGRVADRSGRYWPIALAGYAVNVLCVPALALARSWPAAGALFVGERFGRGVRKPSAATMLSHAGSQLGQGWVFGFHEFMDQTGATVGPLVVALVLALHGGFARAFGTLAIPAALTLVSLALARVQYPSPAAMESRGEDVGTARFGPRYWRYVAGAACLGAGFADFALLSFHFSKSHLLSDAGIPVLYAAAMLAAAFAAPLLGLLYDRFATPALLASFAACCLFAPLGFLGGTASAVCGALVWGIGMSAQETLVPSVLVKTVAPERRATAIGTLDGIYGVAWFAGSVVIGALYDVSIVGLVIFSVVLQIVGVTLFAFA